MKIKTSKTQKRIEWITKNKKAILDLRRLYPESTNSKNAARCHGMSLGGFGYWVQAFNAAGISVGAQNYWSGHLPTPSTAINLAVAQYIRANAPRDIQ